MIKIEMKTKILLAAVILLSIFLGAAAVYLPTSQKEVEMKKELTAANNRSVNLEKQIISLQQSVSEQIIEKKETALADTREGMLYFSNQSRRLPDNTYQVDIYLKGDPKTTADAADLVLSYPPSVHIKEIRKGTAFASYPRLIDENNTVTVTGVALPQGDSFVYAKANELYATLIVEKSGGTASLELNTKDSQVYLNGTPILDFTQSFPKIDL